MDLTGIIAISGKPGLYKVVAQSKNSLIVESIEDGKKFPAHSSNKVSSLSDISIYTQEEDVPLSDVFTKVFDNLKGGQAIDPKSSGEELRAFMDKVFPEYDKERVYNSDIKKLFQWYNSLLDKGLLNKAKEEDTTEETATTKKAAPKKEATKSTAKKTAPKSEPKAAKPAAKKTPNAVAKQTKGK